MVQRRLPRLGPRTCGKTFGDASKADGGAVGPARTFRKRAIG